MTDIRNIPSGEFTFRVRTVGNETDEPIIFLHGFPETSAMWSKLMDSFASRGFFCIAPDMRGYSEQACPKGVKNYTVTKISEDILGIADALSIEQFHLVGHDWGAAIGWHMVHEHANRIKSWSALSVPHNRAFAKAYKTDPEQKKKSRYIGWFMLPIIPEFMIRRNDFAAFRKLWKRSSPDEVEDYLSVFRRKKSLTGALNYYRANLGKGKAVRLGEITTPTLFIWGNRDLAIGATAAYANEKYMKGPYTFLEVEGGHWLIQSNYDQVASAITEFIKENL
mgnify:CR=1 FL=1